MKMFIIGLGFVVGLGGLFMAHAAMEAIHHKEKGLSQLTTEILDLKEKISRLRGLHRDSAVHLEKAYVDAVNDMHLHARAHRMACVLRVDRSQDGDIVKGARPSMFPGLRAIDLNVAFSGLMHKETLFSLLDALNAFEEDAPAYVRRVNYEKDTLVLDFEIMGI